MHITTRRWGPRLIAVAGASALIAPLAVSATSWAAPDFPTANDGRYIVMLQDQPVAAYDGGVKAIPATKPKAGQKVNVHSAAAKSYTDYLVTEHNDVLRSVGLKPAAKTYDYTVSFNGFAAELTGKQVNELRKSADVAMVWEDEVRHTDTVNTPDMLGLRGPGGVWDTQFGGDANAGKGIIVGVIDTGFWPESESFASMADRDIPEGWGPGSPKCEEGVDPDADGNITCNNKVIGARWYPLGNDTSFDFLSPRDTNGHGSHTASTSAGNSGVHAEIGGVPVGIASGMAPAAQIAMYKALWQTADGGGSGNNSSIVMAIDDAVADGVDVINYSISGSSQYIVTADEIAFLGASTAGVFVSASAGNSGDTLGAGSVAHNSPWEMTVAASTTDVNNNKFVVVGPDDRVDRYAGADRYATAAEVATHYPDGVDTVYIATGQAYTDALAGASPASRGMVPSAKSPNVTPPDGSPAPVLLTRTDRLPAATMAALDDIDPDNIVVLGGTAAVSQAVADQLATYGTVTRIGGADRYETAAMIAMQFGTPDQVYVSSGQDGGWADALTGAALAGSQDLPVLLTRKNSVPASLSDALSEMGDPEVVVLGGSAAVSDAVYDQLGASERLAGSNRYGTSVAIAAEFGYGGGTDAPEAYVATGLQYPDALAGSALAAYEDSPVMLTRTNKVPANVMDALVDINPGQVHILGGTAAVAMPVEDELKAAFVGDGEGRYDGLGVGDGVGPAPLVNSEKIPAAGQTAADAKLCVPGSLDPAEADGKIVICTRGAIARVDKSAAVEEAGGIGMILANNNDTESLNADYHSVPTIHVNGTAGDAIKAYEDSAANPTAYISASGQGTVVFPEMAGFSSYGPAIAGGGDLLKPDITAPGVDIIAAVAPPGNNGENFFAYSGTSMAAPHVAGLAALMSQKYPGWSPAAIKSAMMTTADPLNSEGENIHYAGAPSNALHYGSGHVEPKPSYNVPLVYDAGLVDYLGYICAIGQGGLIGFDCTSVRIPVPDPSDLNYPSIAIGDLGGSQTVTRTVTATGAGGTFTAAVEEPDGMTVTVEPSTIMVPAGGEATFEVTITNNSAPLEEWAFGSLTWQGPGSDTRSPIAVRPLGIGAPGEVAGSGTDGSTTVTVTPGFTGTLTSNVHGLTQGDTTNVAVTSDGPGGGGGIADEILPITVPTGVSAIRVETFQDEITVPDADVDIYLADASGVVIAQSTNGGSDEQLTVLAPDAGNYLLAIDYWSGDDGETVNVPVHVYQPGADEGNMTVTPSPIPVVSGVSVDLSFDWTGLTADSRYFGVVGYSDGTEEVGHTMVTIDTGTP